MAHQPTREQLDNELPELVNNLTKLLDRYKIETGADNRFIRMVLGGLMNQYKSPLEPKPSRFR